MPKAFSPEAQKVIRKIATSKNPFQKLERLLKMDSRGEVLKQQGGGKVVIACREAMEQILMTIANPRKGCAKKVVKIVQSDPGLGLAGSESPNQAKESNGKDDEPQDLPKGHEAK